MNELGRALRVNQLLRRAIHQQMIVSRGWDTEIDKLTLDQRRELARHANDLHDRLKARFA